MDVLALDVGYLWSQWFWPPAFVTGLGLVVFVHELGHFLAAKRAGVKVEEFAFGFGPALLKFGRGRQVPPQRHPARRLRQDARQETCAPAPRPRRTRGAGSGPPAGGGW